MERIWERRALLVFALLLALGVRVGWAVQRPETPQFPDSADYLSIAENLLESGTYVAANGERAGRMPGYPLFLAVLIAGFGKQLFLIRLVQALLEVGSICVLVALLRVFSYRNGAIAAAFIYALYPTLVFMSGTLLSETLFCFWLLVGMYALASVLFDDGDWVAGAGVGVGFGLAFLTHPSVLLLLPILCLVSAVAWRHRERTLRSLAVAFLFFLFVLSPWVVRNAVVLGGFVPATTQGGADLMKALGPEATGGSSSEFPPFSEKVRAMGERERSRYLFRETWKHVKADPPRVLDLAVPKFVRTWSPVPNYERYRTRFYMVVLAAPYLTVLLFAALSIGFVHSVRHVLFLLAPVLYVALVHVVFIGSIRYRIPVMPYLIGLAGVGVSGGISGFYRWLSGFFRGEQNEKV